MKHWLLAVSLICFGSSAQAHTFTGRFDWPSLPAYGAWQSVESADQAIGLSKHIWTAAEDGNAFLSLGVFAGVKKPVFSDPPSPLKPLAGPVAAVPGSTLDWLLGTKWGEAWLPKLKTGMTFSYDLTRPGLLHARPTFIGVGVTYPVGF